MGSNPIRVSNFQKFLSLIFFFFFTHFLGLHQYFQPLLVLYFGPGNRKSYFRPVTVFRNLCKKKDLLEWDSNNGLRIKRAALSVGCWFKSKL